MNRSGLVVTRLDGPVDSDSSEQQNPTWREIEAAIRRLNGDTCTLVILGIGDPPVPHMAIGGGEDGNYIVYITDDNEVFYKLVCPQAPSGKRTLVAGGQLGNYELRMCVSLSDAVRAARTYAEQGKPEPSLAWEKQG
jgi:hypothetical protein